MKLKEQYKERETELKTHWDDIKDLWEDEEGAGGPGESDGEGEGNGEGEPGENGEGEGQGQGQGQGEGCEGDGEGNGEGEAKPGEGQGNGTGGGPTQELTDKQLKELLKALEKQKKFQDGETKKSKLKKGDKKLVDAAKDSDASVEKVNYESTSTYGGGSHSTDVVVIRKINEATKGVSDMFSHYTDYQSEKAVPDGLRLGAMLGKKLQVRNDDTTTRYNRQKRGAIDRRLLADLGVGNTKIFEQSFTTSSNDAGIHISIDASGSMGGDRWYNAIKTAVAVIKAADMVGGIRVRVDVRATDGCQLHNKSHGATVVVVYDSKVNGLNHVRKYFPYLSTAGGTPEGLCFAAIKDIITQGGVDTDRYFINMSDGAPSSQYVDLTTKSVKDFKRAGINVLSYYIGYGTQRNNTFDRMYGDSAEYVDTNNVMQIAKTMNKMLAKKG